MAEWLGIFGFHPMCHALAKPKFNTSQTFVTKLVAMILANFGHQDELAWPNARVVKPNVGTQQNKDQFPLK
jgi:hypothetical protein